MCKIRTIFLLILSISIYISCSDPTGGSGSDPGTETGISAPNNVTVAVDGDTMVISWNSLSGVEYYKIYRKVGSGDYELISSGVTSNTYTDMTVPPDSYVQYAVRSFSPIYQSPLSEPSDPISIYVQRLKASLLEYNDRITISWNKHPEAESYRVYRGLSEVDTPVEVAEFSSSDDTVSYSDIKTASNNISEEQPYFYRITWEKEGSEYGAYSPMVMGVFTNNIDYDEPDNDDYVTLPDNTYTPSSANPPLIYSFSDGAGGSEADIDWYRYHGDPENVTVNIDLTSGDFYDNELKIRFFYNNEYLAPQDINNGENTYLFDFQGATGTVNLYFKVYPVVSSSRNVIGSYYVEIKNEL